MLAKTTYITFIITFTIITSIERFDVPDQQQSGDGGGGDAAAQEKHKKKTSFVSNPLHAADL